MALVTIYLEDKQFHTYNGTDKKVVKIDEPALRALISSTTTYSDLHAWATAKADEILDGATEIGVYRSNIDTTVELVAIADFKDYLDLTSDNLISMIFGALNKKVKDGDVVAFVFQMERVRHFCEVDNIISMRPRMVQRANFGPTVSLDMCHHKPEATSHLPYTLYKHLTTPYA